MLRDFAVFSVRGLVAQRLAAFESTDVKRLSSQECSSLFPSHLAPHAMPDALTACVCFCCRRVATTAAAADAAAASIAAACIAAAAATTAAVAATAIATAAIAAAAISTTAISSTAAAASPPTPASTSVATAVPGAGVFREVLGSTGRRAGGKYCLRLRCVFASVCVV